MRSLLRLVLALVAAPLLAASAPTFKAWAAPAKTERAVFAGGCFWCMESDMKAIPGVISVQSGYTGGHLRNPTYQDVIKEKTGHYESVRVTYDPAKVSYRALLNRYWKLVDPTDAGGQFCDRGPSYKTAVFVTPAQKPIAEASRAEAAKQIKVGKMTTEILPLQTFYPAEEYHRDYAKRNTIRYEIYRQACGRDRKLAQVWGRAGE